MTIIEGLVAEHRVFLALFAQIERALPTVKTVEELGLLCRMVAGLLRDHGGAERDLAYIALDHILHDEHGMNRLHHDHQELDHLLEAATATTDLNEARKRLRKALDANRRHFEDEERNVFPLMEEALQHETLVVLGKAWKAHVHH